MSHRRDRFSARGTKKIRESKKKDHSSSKRPASEKAIGKLRPNHSIAEEFQVSLHAVYRFAERVLDKTSRDLNHEDVIFIAKTIRESLPTHMLNETEYLIMDDLWAVVNSDLIVTVIDKSH